MNYPTTIFEIQNILTNKIRLGKGVKFERSEQKETITDNEFVSYTQFLVTSSTVSLTINVKRVTPANTLVEIILESANNEFPRHKTSFYSVRITNDGIKKFTNEIKGYLKALPDVNMNPFEHDLRIALAADIKEKKDQLPADTGIRDVKRFGYKSVEDFLITLARLVDNDHIDSLMWYRTRDALGEPKLKVFIASSNFAKALGYNSWTDFIETWEWVTESNEEECLDKEYINDRWYRVLTFK